MDTFLSVILFLILQNCQLESQGEKTNPPSTLVAPPPLTPINTFKSAGVQSTTVLPKLQRIPRPDDPSFLTDKDVDVDLDDFQDMPTLIPGPGTPENCKSVTPPPPVSTVSENKSIVGSVTTWLPHNSKIVDNIPQNNCEEPAEVPRPQYVEFLAGRKFLVIPKHNIMSVSPTVATSAVARAAISKISESLKMSTATLDPENLNTDPYPDPVLKPTSESPSKPENSHVPEPMEPMERNEQVADVAMDEKTNDDDDDGKVVEMNEE